MPTPYQRLNARRQVTHGLGAVDATTSSLTNYTAVSVPASVNNFYYGSYNNGVWSVPVPGSNGQPDSLEASYVAKMVALITSVNNYRITSTATEPPLATAGMILDDLQFFKNYIQTKYQVAAKTTSPAALNYVYGTVFNNNYQPIVDFLTAQESASVQNALNNAQLTISTDEGIIHQMQYDFYLNTVVPLANNFSQDDQQLIQNVFVNDPQGSVFLSDLVLVLTKIAPYMTCAQFLPLYNFVPDMILPVYMAGDLFLSTQPTISAQITELTGKFNSIVAKLGSWLDPASSSVFAQFIQKVGAGVLATAEASQLEHNIQLAIANAVSSVTHLLQNGANCNPQNLPGVGNSISSSDPSPSGNVINNVLIPNATITPTSNSNIIPLIAAGIAAWFLLA